MSVGVAWSLRYAHWQCLTSCGAAASQYSEYRDGTEAGTDDKSSTKQQQFVFRRSRRSAAGRAHGARALPLRCPLAAAQRARNAACREQWTFGSIIGVLFSTKSGKEINALPSRIIWQDDATDPNKVCSVLVRTSERKYQAFIQLDRLASTEERKRLALTWRAESTDSEDAQNVSKDVAHHVRIPGGHNSKGHGWHPVTYAQASERTYSADRLLARCGETHLPCSSGGISKDRAAQHQADAWAELPNGGALLRSKRWQAIAQSRPQLRQLLIEHQRVTIDG